MTARAPTAIPRRQHLSVVKCIDKGSYGIVYQADERLALKASSNAAVDAEPSATEFGERVEDSENPGTAETTFGRAELVEAMILRRATARKAPHIVRLEKIYFDSFIKGQQHALVLQLQLAECSLIEFAAAHRDRLKSLPIRRKILYDTALAVQFLHAQLGVAHADIKPANILINTHGDASDANSTASAPLPYCRLADFGMSTMPALAAHGHASVAYTFAYRAPELFDNLYEPTLIRATSESMSALCNKSCFDRPISLQQQQSKNNSQNVAATPLSLSTGIATTSSAAVGTPSILFCEEKLDQSPSTTRGAAQQATDAVTSAPPLLMQATDGRFANVTCALFASDIWALGSVALYLLTCGRHPIERYIGWIQHAAFTHAYYAALQPESRVQLYAWHKLVANHQTDDAASRLFAFDVILQNFEACVLPHSLAKLPIPHTLDTLTADCASEETDLLVECLQFDPRARLTAQQLCTHAFFHHTDNVGDDEKKDEKKRTRSSLRIAKKTETAATMAPLSRLGLALQAQRLASTTLLRSRNAAAYLSSMRLLLSMCEQFQFCFKTALLAIAYLQQTAHTILGRPYETWTEPQRATHVAVCVLTAVTIYEPRHTAGFDSVDLADTFGQECGFSHRDVADLQRIFCETVQFEFDMPTLATFIDESLCETNSMGEMPVERLLQDVTCLALQSSNVHLSAAESVMTALSLLRRHKCTVAFQHLLRASGRQQSAVDATLRLIEPVLLKLE